CLLRLGFCVLRDERLPDLSARSSPWSPGNTSPAACRREHQRQSDEAWRSRGLKPLESDPLGCPGVGGQGDLRLRGSGACCGLRHRDPLGCDPHRDPAKAHADPAVAARWRYRSPMMRAARRATLLVAFSLLTSAATAHAECAWVLWRM